MKPILCLDFDGVCHMYTSGWQGAANIPDAPVPGLFEFLVDARREFEIHIFSSRSHQEGGLEAMKAWFEKHSAGSTQFLKFPTEKPPAFLGIDDRVLTFEGTFPTVETLRKFRPWNKRSNLQ